MVRRSSRILAALAAAASLLMLSGSARAVGYWNVPGNFCQCWGYGWGAGHHACLTLGPITHEGCFAHNTDRLSYAPRPPYACYGAGSYNYDFRQPVDYAPVHYQSAPQQELPSEPEMTPEVLPLPEEAQPEASEPTRAIFDAPVER
jgi:hypothetical protein